MQCVIIRILILKKML